MLRDETGEIVNTQTTDENGQAWFTLLPPGTYTVEEDTSQLPEHVMPSPGADGFPGADEPRMVTISSGQEHVYTPQVAMLLDGQEEVFNDNGNGNNVDENLIFGNFLKGSIHVFGFEDMDADGRYEPGEGL